MKSITRPGFRPKPIVPGLNVGWWPTVAVGYHGVVAHWVAWPGRRGGPQCARGVHGGATGRGHRGRSRCGGVDGHGSLPAGSRARARGRWEG
jgi:hypothetical protein